MMVSMSKPRAKGQVTAKPVVVGILPVGRPPAVVFDKASRGRGFHEQASAGPTFHRDAFKAKDVSRGA